jgi:hypothetical protein
VHELADGMAVVYARLPGEAWQLGAGYAVARQGYKIEGLAGVLSQADSKDKDAVKRLRLAAIAVGAIAIGLLLSLWEYTSPLKSFRRQVKALSAGSAPRFAVDKLRAPYRQLGLDMNLALDRVARAGGEAAPISIGFDQMFGDSSAQPAMSAFGVPPSTAPAASAEAARQSAAGAAPVVAAAAPPRRPVRSATQPIAAPAPEPMRPEPEHAGAHLGGTVVGLGAFAPPAADPSYTNLQAPDARFSDPPPLDGGHGSGVNGSHEVEPEWTQVYQDFVRIKQDCGEAVEGFTFERFTQTLRKNRDTLMREHGVHHVQFSAYVKQGRAALKAKPVRQ